MADDPSSTHPGRRRTFLAVALLTGTAVVSGCTGQADGASTSADVADRGVQLLGVDVKDQRQLAQAFVDTVGVTYPSSFDPRGEVALAFRGFSANVVPATILLDRRYRVAAVNVATVPEEDLRAALDLLLAEEPAP